MSLSPRGRGQAGEPVAGTSRVSLVHAVSWAGARSLGARMLRHRESIVLKMYSSLGNVTNKRTGLRVHTEEEPWRSVNVCFRLDTLSQRCYCKMYVNMQGAVRVLSSISVSIGMTKCAHTYVDTNVSTQSAISDSFFFFFKYVKAAA